MTESILVLNAGSSSIKFQLFDVGGRKELGSLMKGQVEGIGTRPRLLAKLAGGEQLADESWPAAEVASVPAALDKALIFLRAQRGGELPAAIGHRVVHGGPNYCEPTIVSETVVQTLER
jgi:acetate kinase